MYYLYNDNYNEYHIINPQEWETLWKIWEDNGENEEYRIFFFQLKNQKSLENKTINFIMSAPSGVLITDEKDTYF